jgi:hypothetical protein
MTLPYPDRQQLTGLKLRLIQVHSASDDQSLKCDLVTRDLTNDIEYNALSYVWGSTSSGKELLLNGHAMQVTESLHSALMRYRNSEHTQFLWADAVCINQQDNDEKTHQVRMMKMIY